MTDFSRLRQAWDELTAPGAPFAWSVAQVRGVPTRSYDALLPSVSTVWQSTLGYGDREYLVFGDYRITYEQAHDEVDGLARYLAHEAGIRPGDRVVIAMRNYPEWALAYWAIVKLGAVAVGLNAWWTTAELSFGIADSEPKMIIADVELLARIEAADDGNLMDRAEMSTILVRADSDRHTEHLHWENVVDHGRTLPELSQPQIDLDDDLCIFYTSGTTGSPKGAALTHRSCLTNLYNLAFWSTLMTTVEDGPSISIDGGTDGGQITALLAVPLFHVTANNCGLYPYSALGGKVVLMHKWDAEEALRLIEREGVNVLSGVPTMAREIVEHPTFATYDTSTLIALGGGGAAVQPDLVDKIENTLPNGRAATGYGLTETSGVITMNSADFFAAKPQTVGPALPVMETRIVDSDGRDVDPGSIGELWVRGANVFRGYVNRDEATAEVLTDGWFHTGDLAMVDTDQFVTIVDRLKDMVIRGGENIYCAEVEAAFFSHAAVKECAVFGLPDRRLGEVPAAAIVLHPGWSCTSDELRAYVGSLIASFKVPDKIWFVDEPLPRNASGKFLKNQLRESLLEP